MSAAGGFAGPASGPLQLSDLGRLDFTKGDGLIPAVVQHALTGAVLMLGYMNP